MEPVFLAIFIGMLGGVAWTTVCVYGISFSAAAR